MADYGQKSDRQMPASGQKQTESVTNEISCRTKRFLDRLVSNHRLELMRHKRFDISRKIFHKKEEIRTGECK